MRKGILPIFTAMFWLALAANLGAAYTTVLENGSASNRVNMVFLGDGYTASQIETTYVADINKFLNHLFNKKEDVFVRYKNFFNAYRINVISNESGADVPPKNIYRDTALDAKYYYDGVTERLLYVSNSKANTAMNNGLAGSGITVGMKLVTVNDTRYGGGGGSYAVYAGGNSSAPEVALHELAHSFSGLADEYSYSSSTYTGPEPSQANVTKDPTGQKWSQWLGYVDPAHPELGAVGAYEGAMYHDHGLYRPTLNSKMRNLNVAFNAVSREKIILDIYGRVHPIDSSLANQGTLVDPQSLWIDVVDPGVIKVQWAVDGKLLPGATSEAFDPWQLAPGLHTITALAYDDTPWVRLENNLLSQSIAWTVDITTIAWTKGTDGLWTEPASWAGGNVPNDTDNVLIRGSVTVIDDRPITEVNNLKITQNASLFCHSLIADLLMIGNTGAAAVPEPGSIVLLMAGTVIFGLWRWRKAKTTL